jgi:hypothetical protein
MILRRHACANEWGNRRVRREAHRLLTLFSVALCAAVLQNMKSQQTIAIAEALTQ